jgi:hypothetical protein
MDMNDNNREIFKDVVQALEEAAQQAAASKNDCDCAAAEKMVSDSISIRS